LRRFAARRRGCEGAILRRSLWLAALVCACALLVACGSRQASSNVQIVPIETTPGVAQAARPPSVTPAAGWSPTASVANVATSATPQTATATPALPDSYSIAIAPDALAAIGGAFDSLVGTVSGVTLQTQPAVDSSAALRAPADLALDLRQPGAPALTGAVAVRRQPIALAVPWLLAPDDLTLQQAVDLLTGVATNWRNRTRRCWRTSARWATARQRSPPPRASPAPRRCWQRPTPATTNWRSCPGQGHG
jgi:hypothetical protein